MGVGWGWACARPRVTARRRDPLWPSVAFPDRTAQVIGEMWRNPPPPAKSYVTKWGRDRYSRGSYSFIPVGATLGDVKKYGEPVDGRLYFAGEGTSLWDPSVAHGAYATGVFSAWDVMQALRKPLPSQGWGLRQYEERYTPHVRQLEKMKRKPSPQYVPLQVR